MNKLQEKRMSMDKSGGRQKTEDRSIQRKKWYGARLYFLIEQENNHYSKLSREVNGSRLMGSVLNYFKRFNFHDS